MSLHERRAKPVRAEGRVRLDVRRSILAQETGAVMSPTVRSGRWPDACIQAGSTIGLGAYESN